MSESDDKPISRRRMFREGMSLIGRVFNEFAEGAKDSDVDRGEVDWNPLEPSRGVLRPPGAVEEELFMSLCTKCDECINACPEDVLFRAPESFGDVAGTPTFIPTRKACFLCSELHCIPVCEPKALRMPSSVGEINIGKARLDPSKCRAYEGEDCDWCFQLCPLSGTAIVMLGERPAIKVLECVGCGLCEYYCRREAGRPAIEILPPPAQ